MNKRSEHRARKLAPAEPPVTQWERDAFQNRDLIRYHVVCFRPGEAADHAWIVALTLAGRRIMLSKLEELWATGEYHALHVYAEVYEQHKNPKITDDDIMHAMYIGVGLVVRKRARIAPH